MDLLFYSNHAMMKFILVLAFLATAIILIEFKGVFIFESILQSTTSAGNEIVSKVIRTSPKTKESIENSLWRVENILQDRFLLCNGDIFLLVLVVSSPENFERRLSIRNSWANTTSYSGVPAKTIFLVGTSENRYLNVLVGNEFQQFNDILLGEYVDTYRNLTLKVLDGFKWAYNSCRSSYIVKTDDDCFVNVHAIGTFLQKVNNTSGELYVGRIRRNAKVIRDCQSRWFVPKEIYPNSYYSPYVSGAGYIMSWDVLEKLVKASVFIKPFPNEDAYVGEVLHLARVTPVHSTRFASHSTMWTLCNYLYLFVIHGVKANMQTDLQKKADEAKVQCKSFSFYKEWS